MQLDNFRVMRVILAASTFDEAKQAVVEEVILQLEEQHQNLSLELQVPLNEHIEDLGYQESLKVRLQAVEEQIDQMQNELHNLGGNHGTEPSTSAEA